MINIDISNKKTGKFVNNTAKALCVFDPVNFLEIHKNMPDNWFKETYPFIDYLILMTFTGGTGVNEWYTEDENHVGHFDFTKPISMLKTVLRLGVKPFIVIGNVPYAMSIDYDKVADSYGWGNRYEPKDYDLYYNYISSFAKAIKENFTKEEYSTWRFRVGTETDNSHWWMSGQDAYCKLYDYTVAALCDILGEENVYISFANTENYHNSEKYLEHCARGVNYYTGKVGTKCDYFSFSHYQLEFKGNCIKYFDYGWLMDDVHSLIEKFPELHLKEINIGEGQFLSDGIGENPCRLQMGQDASEYGASWMMDMFIESNKHNIDYFANWSYAADCFILDEPVMKVPAYFSAEILNRVKNKEIIESKIDGETQFEGSVNAIAVEEENKKWICLCNHAFTRENISEDISLVVENVSYNAKIKAFIVDEHHSNFFTEWRKIAQEYSLNEDMPIIDIGSLGSPVETEVTRISSDECIKVWREFKKNNHDKIHLESFDLNYSIAEGKLKTEITMPGHSVMFIEIVNE